MTAPAHDDACGLGEGTHFACDCTLRRLAELEAEVARLRNGLVIAESFVRTSTEVLREIEWEGEFSTDATGLYTEACPACRRCRTEGHESGCRLAALLQGGTP